jgi:hypothetical protein
MAGRCRTDDLAPRRPRQSMTLTSVMACLFGAGMHRLGGMPLSIFDMMDSVMAPPVHGAVASPGASLQAARRGASNHAPERDSRQLRRPSWPTGLGSLRTPKPEQDFV